MQLTQVLQCLVLAWVSSRPHNLMGLCHDWVRQPHDEMGWSWQSLLASFLAINSHAICLYNDTALHPRCFTGGASNQVRVSTTCFLIYWLKHAAFYLEKMT
jgi:hypothetical protein